jgi:amino-acid N-acetyltransferase
MSAAQGLIVRPAAAGDLPAIATRIRYWADRRVLLPVEPADLNATLPAFRVLTRRGSAELLAFASLRRHSAILAEIRSLVVADEYQGNGMGRRLVEHLLEEAAAGGVRRVFVVTRSPRLFERLGFATVPRAAIAEKVEADCSRCLRLPLCDLAALARDLA